MDRITVEYVPSTHFCKGGLISKKVTKSAVLDSEIFFCYF
jgi:hypothetical protein